MNFLFPTGTNKDSLFSWYTTVLCLLVLILTTCFVSGLGNIFVAIHNSYGVTREDAAIPLNAMLSVYQFTGLISGPILQKFSVRNALFIAVSVEFVGAFLQFFSPMKSEFKWIVICMVIRGAGMGIVSPILLQVVSTHFERHRAKALMIVFLGYSLSGVILPFIVDHTYKVYGLKGSWLIHCAMIGQSLVLVSLIRSRDEYVKDIKINSNENLENEIIARIDIQTENDILEDEIALSHSESYESNDKLQFEKPDQDKTLVVVKSDRESFFKSLARLSKNPIMYIIVLSEVFGLSGYFLCNTTLVDYALDKNLPKSLASLMLVVHGLGELFGKLPTSWCVDKQLFSNEAIVGTAMLSSSVLYGVLTFSKGNYFVAVVFFIGVCFGSSQVSRIPLFPLLGVNTTALTYGVAASATGGVVIFLPELIGKFRDEMKDYKYIYVIFGTFLLLSSLSHFCTHICERRRPKFKDTRGNI